jgi:hypothetical protein
LSPAIAFFEDLVEVGAGIDVVERPALSASKRPICSVTRLENLGEPRVGVDDLVIEAVTLNTTADLLPEASADALAVVDELSGLVRGA